MVEPNFDLHPRLVPASPLTRPHVVADAVMLLSAI